MIVNLHIPKTGGTSFGDILENNFGLCNCHSNQINRSTFTRADLNFARKFFPRMRSLTGHNLIDPPQLAIPDAFYTIFLRDPVARVISHYQYSVQHGGNKKSFEETLKVSENLENLQVKLIAGGPDLDKAKRFLEQCSFVGLTEKFDLSLCVLEGLSPWKLNLNYKKRVVAQDYAIKDSLDHDERMKELAREYNRLDLELYQFAANEILPRLCRKAGVDPANEIPSYQSAQRSRLCKVEASRVYNRLFRRICRFRYDVLVRDPRPRIGNTAQDIFAPMLERDPNRA
ncbi:MAG TPA: sulfotransferase family 2 domain-containing protein [Verrucomicrobiae bacterium]|nr:sulfotransferase family 2 domain-containing protein [Verrucomicrobiae bacterium]